MDEPQAFDVVIAGGGLAGLALARQLRLELPSLSVAVIDRLARPLPEAAFKVGESSIELGTYYFGQVLKLDPYFRSRHLPKLGLRFFFGNAQGPLENRPETGSDMFPPVPSYQIDRGRLENDLRQIVCEMGVALFEGTTVDDIVLGQGESVHAITCRRIPGGEPFTITGRWLADATGRRCLLQSRLGLRRQNGHHASAAWWRYNGRIDVDALGAKGGRAWRAGCVEDRYFSTNHLMGKGYWVWLIPLGSGKTSVGIVTDESVHPQRTYGTSYQQALSWLRVNEPALHAFIKGESPLDFLSFKGYSYGSEQVFSHHRWSCVGEAGFFLDPLYSLGSDFICITNTTTVELIRRDRAGELTEEVVAQHNELVLNILYRTGLDYYRGVYRAFGHAQIFTPKLAWDTAIIWSVHVPGVRPGIRAAADAGDHGARPAVPRSERARGSAVRRLVGRGAAACNPRGGRHAPHEVSPAAAPGSGCQAQSCADAGSGSQEPGSFRGAGAGPVLAGAVGVPSGSPAAEDQAMDQRLEDEARPVPLGGGRHAAAGDPGEAASADGRQLHGPLCPAELARTDALRVPLSHAEVGQGLLVLPRRADHLASALR